MRSEIHETYNEKHSNQRTTQLIRSKLWQVLQNALRLAVTVGIPFFLLWEGGFLDSDADKIPWWVILVLGALIGGFASTPLSNFANLIWEIFGIFMRRGIEDRAARGSTEEESIVLKRLEYRSWVRWARKSNFFIIVWTVSRRAFLPTVLLMAIISIPAMVAAFLVSPRIEIVPLTLLAMVIAAIPVAIVFGVATGIWIKAFYHQE